MTPEQRHMGKVAALGCILCDYYGFPGVPAQVHHILTGRTPGRRCSDWLTIPLCPACHQDGQRSIHKLGAFQFDIAHGISELGLLAIVYRRIYGNAR